MKPSEDFQIADRTNLTYGRTGRTDPICFLRSVPPDLQIQFYLGREVNRRATSNSTAVENVGQDLDKFNESVRIL